jgi:hypothetical protein
MKCLLPNGVEEFHLLLSSSFANYLWTMYWSIFGLKEWVRINSLNYVIFPAKIQISKSTVNGLFYNITWWTFNKKAKFKDNDLK